MAAHYEGRPIVELLPNGRYIRFTSDFAFIDEDNLPWRVPSDAVVDEHQYQGYFGA
jgi:hypothetical protein